MVIIDKITLLDKSFKEDFERWVVDVDYLACAQLPSVKSFSVCLMASGDADYIEIIHVTSEEDFKRDMDTPSFQSLVSRFCAMAKVVDTIVADPIPPGYRC